jgi:hypothetical protein
MFLEFYETMHGRCARVHVNVFSFGIFTEYRFIAVDGLPDMFLFSFAGVSV